jgi:hypothetical protein
MTFRVDLNTGTATLPVWTDVTSYVRSWSFSRGRDRFLSGFQAGDLSITFDNRLRTFDPLNSSSPVQSAIVPRGQVRVFWDYATFPGGTRTNLVLNPSLETNTTYTAGGFTRESTFSAYYGTYYGSVTTAASPNPRFDTDTLATSTRYAVSAYVRAQKVNLTDVDLTYSLGIRYGSTEVAYTNFTMPIPSTVGVGAWQRVTAVFVTPSSVDVSQHVVFIPVSPPASSQVFHVDAVMVEASEG